MTAGAVKARRPATTPISNASDKTSACVAASSGTQCPLWRHPPVQIPAELRQSAVIGKPARCPGPPGRSEPAESNVGGQDRLGADPGEFVHDGVDVAARDRGAHGHPPGRNKRGYRRGFQARGDRRRAVHQVAGGTVVQHQVPLAEHHALYPAGQLVSAARFSEEGRSRSISTASGVAQRLTEGLEGCACAASGPSPRRRRWRRPPRVAPRSPPHRPTGSPWRQSPWRQGLSGPGWDRRWRSAYRRGRPPSTCVRPARRSGSSTTRTPGPVRSRTGAPTRRPDPGR